MEKIRLEADNGQNLEFYVEEQIRIGGCDYLLVSIPKKRRQRRIS